MDDSIWCGARPSCVRVVATSPKGAPTMSGIERLLLRLCGLEVATEARGDTIRVRPPNEAEIRMAVLEKRAARGRR